MGYICSIYIIPGEEFEKAPKTYEAIEAFLEKNSPLVEKDGYYYFKKRYDTDKAWNPTFELLNKILSKKKNLFVRPAYKADDLDLYYYHDKKTVASIAQQLSAINQKALLNWLDNTEISNQIKNSEGYRMEAIDSPDLIIQHFDIIKSAYIEASSKNQSIVLSFGKLKQDFMYRYYPVSLAASTGLFNTQDAH